MAILIKKGYVLVSGFKREDTGTIIPSKNITIRTTTDKPVIFDADAVKNFTATKLDKSLFDAYAKTEGSYVQDLNNRININESGISKLKSDVLAKADKTAVDLKADKTAVDLKADKTAVDLKANNADLVAYAQAINNLALENTNGLSSLSTIKQNFGNPTDEQKLVSYGRVKQMIDNIPAPTSPSTQVAKTSTTLDAKMLKVSSGKLSDARQQIENAFARGDVVRLVIDRSNYAPMIIKGVISYGKTYKTDDVVFNDTNYLLIGQKFIDAATTPKATRIDGGTIANEIAAVKAAQQKGEAVVGYFYEGSGQIRAAKGKLFAGSTEIVANPNKTGPYYSVISNDLSQTGATQPFIFSTKKPNDFKQQIITAWNRGDVVYYLSYDNCYVVVDYDGDTGEIVCDDRDPITTTTLDANHRLVIGRLYDDNIKR